MVQLDVLILTHQKILFKGQAQSVIFPGEEGMFEVGPFHRPLISRLLPGTIAVDRVGIPIQRGVAKVALNSVLAIVEE
jgi:F-type H+-transporting ATPase subunit epsilon